jgi:hypothetical protein
MDQVKNLAENSPPVKIGGLNFCQKLSSLEFSVDFLKVTNLGYEYTQSDLVHNVCCQNQVAFAKWPKCI